MISYLQYSYNNYQHQQQGKCFAYSSILPFKVMFLLLLSSLVSSMPCDYTVLKSFIFYREDYTNSSYFLISLITTSSTSSNNSLTFLPVFADTSKCFNFN